MEQLLWVTDYREIAVALSSKGPKCGWRAKVLALYSYKSSEIDFSLFSALIVGTFANSHFGHYPGLQVMKDFGIAGKPVMVMSSGHEENLPVDDIIKFKSEITNLFDFSLIRSESFARVVRSFLTFHTMVIKD